MTLTNKHGLPEAVVRVLSQDFYDGSSADFSVTQLIESPRIVQLAKRYRHMIQEDVMDRFWTLFGSIAHYMLEQHAQGVAEQRLFADIGGCRVSGKVDCYHDGVITDYKVTTTYGAPYATGKWEKQLNLYAALLRINGFSVTGLNIVVIYRDWRSGIMTQPTPVEIVDIPLWTADSAHEYLEKRVRLHAGASACADSELPPCSDEDMWVRTVSKTGKTDRLRCRRYCQVRKFCELGADD